MSTLENNTAFSFFLFVYVIKSSLLIAINKILILSASRVSFHFAVSCLRSSYALSFLKKIYAAVLGHPVDMPGHSFLFTIFFTSCIPILSILHLSLRVKSLLASLNVWPRFRLAKLYSYKHLLLFSYFHCL